MRREEAIRELKIFSGTTRIRLSANFWEALNTAISALEQEPCEDCINRQAAIDAIKKIHPVDTEYDCTLYDKVDVMYVLKDLPSVKPVACIATVKFSKEDMQKLVNEKMKDIVVERKKGKWIKSNIGGAKVCSICQVHMGLSNFKYCPNCGAEMESEE
jgi:hypothetical protein